MHEPILQVRDLAVAYGQEPVIADFSCAIQKGEFVSLVGANGSGKSTLLRAFSRLIRPVGGQVVVDGADIWERDQAWLARRLAVVPQDSNVAFDFTVLETVLMGRAPHLGKFAIEKTDDMEIALEALRSTSLEALADKPITAISGGERQRAVIARALAQQPSVLLADEPTAHLDINHQIAILELLRGLSHRRQLGLFAALHDLNLASLYSDRIFMLAGGRVLVAGTPSAVITEENVRHAYGIHAKIKPHPTTGRPYMTLAGRHYPRRAVMAADSGGFRSVHVICGAGTGAALLEQLYEEGRDVSAGVVNVADSDQQTAERLDLDRVEEAPFSAISPEAHRQNLALCFAADVVVVCGLPFGEGNLANLEAASEALRHGRRVILANRPPIEERDFTEGRATALFKDMVSRGAVIADEPAPHPAHYCAQAGSHK